MNHTHTRTRTHALMRTRTHAVPRLLKDAVGNTIAVVNQVFAEMFIE